MKQRIEELLFATRKVFESPDFDVEKINSIMQDFGRDLDIKEIFSFLIEDAYSSRPNYNYASYHTSNIHLIRDSNFDFSIISGGDKLKHLYWTPQQINILPITSSSSEFIAEKYKVHVDDSSAFDQNGSLQFESAEPLVIGKSYSFNCHSSHVDLWSTKPSLYLMFNTKPKSNIRWVFERKSLRPIYALPELNEQLHWVSLVSVLGALGESSSIGVLKKMQRHESHFVRWAAVCALANVDTSSGILALEQAASDLHPHVRQAARLTLENYQSND